MALLTDEDIGLGTSVDPLVQAPQAALADMAKQDQPLLYQGKPAYKDPSGQIRYGQAPVQTQIPAPEKAMGGLLSDADIDLPGAKPDLGPMPSWSTGENLAASARQFGVGLASATDLVLGVPAFIGGFIANLGAAGGAAAGGATREEAWAEGRKASEAFQKGGPLAGWQSSPLGKLTELLGDKSTYDESTVSQMMGKISSGIEKAGEWVEEKSGGSIPKDAIATLADSLMIGAGPIGARMAKGLKGEKPGETTPRAEPTTGPAPEGPLEVNIVGGKEGPLPPEAKAAEVPLSQIETEGAVSKPRIKLKSTPEQIRSVEEGAVPTEAPAPETPVEQLPSRGNKADMLAYAKKNNLSLTEAYKVVTDKKAEIAKGIVAGTAGAWLYMDQDQADMIGPAGLLALGAIRTKGQGIFSKEAGTRLANAIDPRIPRTRGVEQVDPATFEGMSERAIKDAKEGFALANWADSRIKTYLNRWAGTKEDPLKDVKIPMLGEGVTWEDAWDQFVKGKEVVKHREGYAIPADTMAYEGSAGAGTARAGETIWGIADQYSSPGIEHARQRAALLSVTNYLSHVGDYLREFVPVEKLQQYDLVRAVKETAKQDEVQAAKMAKARVNQAGTVTFKEYPDGMKWVEVGKTEGPLPKNIIVEQRDSATWVVKEDGKILTDFLGDEQAGWRPPSDVGPEHESLFRTKENAEFAAKEYVANKALKNEGDVMGHCVGGYCEMVHSGESKIYSLRDGKGMSHVTVEVQPPDVRAEHNSPGYYAKIVGGELLDRLNATENKPERIDLLRSIVRSPEYQTWLNRNPSDIVQIKGKQNRAPVEQYLPYVQDFVKSGKWGDVGDLENTGLVKTQRGYEVKSDLIARGEEWQGGGPGFEHWGPRGQRGSVDPKLLGLLAAGGTAAALGAYIDSDNPLRGATLGALGVMGFSQLTRGKGLDYTLGVISTRLGNISPAVRLHVRDYAQHVFEKTDQALDIAHPFLKELGRVPSAVAERVKVALLSGDPTMIKTAMQGNKELQAGYVEIRDLLNSFEAEHKKLRRFKEGISEYFPRIVSDLDGLKKAIGAEAKSRLDIILAKEEAKMIKKEERGLTEVEESIIVNRFLNSPDQQSFLPGYARGRKVDMSEELAKYYKSPTESLLRYISASVQDIEMAKFFGKNLVNRKLGGKAFTDVDGSIGNIVMSELKAGRISREQMTDLRGMLKSLFVAGEKSTSGFLQDVRNATNIGLLGSFHAAATQIGDSIMTVYHHGMLPVLSALKDKLTGNKEISAKEFGLVNHIAEELSNTRITGKALQYVFRANGFRTIDYFAKELNLNAGLIKNQRLAKTASGQAKLAEKWQAAYQEDFPQLVQELQSGQKTPLVRSLLWSELSDAQPISKAEMPQAYLDHPNGRLLYQMKTYMVKQMDVIRRDAYQEIRKGNYVKGAKNLLAVAVALSLSNLPGDLVKDWLSGRPLDLSKIDHVENLLQNFGLNRYTLDKMQGTTPAKATAEFAMGTVKPPIVGMVSDLDKPEKAIKYVPGVGRLIYDKYLGGNEARLLAQDQRNKQAKREQAEADNPVLKERRLRRATEARENALRRIQREAR